MIVGVITGIGSYYFLTMTMMYPHFGSTHSDDNITGHLSADFYSIWNNGLVGISWGYPLCFLTALAVAIPDRKQDATP